MFFSSETGDEVPEIDDSFDVSTPQREEALEAFKGLIGFNWTGKTENGGLGVF